MKNNNAQQPERRNFLILSLFLVLCLPLIVWQVVNDENFDLRNWAFEEVEVSEEYPCVISFPNVNPYSLEANKTVRIQVEGIAQGSGITSVLITDQTGQELFNKNYEQSQQEITEIFEFTPSETREYELIGTLSEDSYSSSCVISSPYDVLGVRAVAENNAPEFVSSPIDSEPSQDIDTGNTYEYTLIASDPEGDFINYIFSFTPNNQWLNYTVINDGSHGNLKIQFKGSTSTPASYLANVFIHDGYSKHLRSQSWIISVDPSENDVPRVTILSPWQALTLSQGEPLSIKWAATDRNAITHYELYLAQNLENEDGWYPVDKEIAYNIEEYTVDTKNISAGTYKAIIKAPDNQDPPLIGKGVSPLIEILGEEFDMPDDKVQLPDPQVINFSPTGEDEITNQLVTIRASLLASTNANIVEDSITIKVDDRDITSLAKFNKISESEYTIIYQTEKPYETGLHKVEISFDDTNELSVNKSWTFNITTEERDPDKFYIFGYGVQKIIVYIVAGGLLLLVLALVVPLILVRVWKEDEETTQKDDIIEPPQPINPVSHLVNEPIKNEDTRFSKLETPPTMEEVREEKENVPPQVIKEKAGGEIKQKIIDAKQKAQERPIEINSSDDTASSTTVETQEIPDPTEDLQLLYDKIKNSTETNNNVQKETEN
jgi:hypothetical protein